MKKSDGITLIALVITIVVLTILSAITIYIVLGENGIINNSIRARENAEKNQIIQLIKTDIYNRKTEKTYSELDENDLEIIFNKYDKDKNANLSGSTKTITLESGTVLDVTDLYNNALD